MVTTRRGAAQQRLAKSLSPAREPISDDKTLTNGITHDSDIMEEEYHTEESENSEPEADHQEETVEAVGALSEVSDDSDSASPAQGPPLLPIDLLQPLPSPAYSPHRLVAIPRSQMSRKDKRAERNRSRKAKKLEWERLRGEAKANGVVAAGRVAQLKRGIVDGGSGRRVKSGRVQKTTKAPLSGRQRMIEQRKREVEKSQVEGKAGSKKAKTRPRR